MGEDFRLWRRKTIHRFLSLVVAALSMINCSNVYEPMSPRDSNDAHYENAMKALNRSDFDSAITYFNRLNASYLDGHIEARENYAGALAGRCGFLFATFYNSISSTNFTTTPLFKALMNQFTQKAVSPSHCALAEAQIKAIWTTNTPTTKQQLFMVMLSMAKMGAYLRSKADHDGVGDLGDGTTDGTFDGCAATDDADHLTDAEMKQIITGFSLMLLNISGFSTALGLGDTVSGLQAICDAIPDSPCAATEVANVTDDMIASMRDLLATNENYTTANGAAVSVTYGIGTCDPATQPAVTMCCP